MGFGWFPLQHRLETDNEACCKTRWRLGGQARVDKDEDRGRGLSVGIIVVVSQL